MEQLRIARYAPGDERGLIPLILHIQREEFGIDISAEDQPDLMQIPSFYQHGSGDFWVARMADAVIGTIGLKDIGNNQAALRKMFVAAAWRGRELGIARQMLALLIETAKQRGIKTIYLGTTDRFLAAHAFYEKHGFSRVSQHDLPSTFPLMAVDTRFYALNL
ncbi:GNAT family N-acetyltransferase [Erwinia billingiae]|uniref:GNAT family N-acetyltransferase n=1 Tax=Erwinia billingiae TaxID=182337 RepID=UPI0022475BF6|nr:GNAT family N-acetyltransferase [Erwinia billingiae]MCX0499911.1 N-acetyltransferase [Erwinia billingiae]